MFKLKIKTFLRKNYPNLYEIIKIIYSRIIFKRKNNIKFSGWGLTTTQSPPWIGTSKNKTYIGFKNAKDILYNKIKQNKFYLSQFYSHPEIKNFDDVIEMFEQLDYRHYIIYYSALLAFENTHSRNIVECGTCDGLTIFFSIAKYKEDNNFKAYLYDSWSEMKSEHLLTKKEKEKAGDYKYLNIDTTKKNLSDFQSNLIFNKGYIPEVFKNSDNPKNISWLHIDLNSSMPTHESLKLFYPILEKNGIIVLDDYGWDGFEETREVVENFFIDKKITFLHLITGQALIIKR